MPEKGYYHCIECDSLFEAPIRDVVDQRCPECGNPPAGEVATGETLAKDLSPALHDRDRQVLLERDVLGVDKDANAYQKVAFEVGEKQVQGHGASPKRQDVKHRQVVIVVAVWLVLALSAIIVVKFFNTEDGRLLNNNNLGPDQKMVEIKADEEKQKKLVRDALPECKTTMRAFLNATTAAEKAQHVYRGAKLAAVMDGYYKKNPRFSPSRKHINIIHSEFLDIPGLIAIKGVCRNNMGERFEAIFIQENNEWKVDWEALVRYDATEWSLFPLGKDGDEGVFRLYLRVLNVGDDLAEKNQMVVFYKPDVYRRKSFNGLASRSVSVPMGSPQGIALQAMLDADDGDDGYRSAIADFDPPGYHRVRVHMRLHKQGKEKPRMELVRLLANHWYGSEVMPEKVEPANSAAGE